MKTIRAMLFGLAMASALGFGAATAMAKAPTDAEICPLTSVGKCSNQDQCQRKCASGTCSNGCCYCSL